jgi:hypothetical protein
LPRVKVGVLIAADPVRHFGTDWRLLVDFGGIRLVKC